LRTSESGLTAARDADLMLVGGSCRVMFERGESTAW